MCHVGEEGYTCISIRTCPCINSFYILCICLAIFLVIILACFDNFLFFFKSFECFSFWSIFTFLCQKSKNTKKVENPKKFDWHYCVLSHTCFALCIYEHSFFSMHSCHCGKNLDIYVIVVNRSSNLSWMISQWFCWS